MIGQRPCPPQHPPALILVFELALVFTGVLA